MNRWQERFPKLFARSAFEWGGVASGDLQIQFSLEPPPDELVSNVKVIGRTAGGVVVCEDVVLEGPPTNPSDGETVTKVLTLPPAEAVAYLAAFDNGPLTEILHLATAMGHLQATPRRP